MAKLKDLISEYGEYEIIDEIKFKSWDATLPEEKSGSIQFESREGIQIRLEPPKPKPKSIWGLESGDKYFILYADGAVTEYEWIKDGYISKSYRDQGNVFLTKEEAEKDAERREVETLLLKYGGRRWFDEHNFNYHIGLDDLEEHLNVYILVTVTQGAIYFDSKDNARKAIDEIGADRIIKALFEVR